MDAWVWLVIGLVLIAALAAAAIVTMNNRRSSELQQRFGPEYDRTVANAGSRRRAESELLARKNRRDELDIRPLPDDVRRRYTTQWHDLQARFVDEPAMTLREADLLVLQVMRDRGYPMDDFEQRAADISVDHPEVVAHYRAAHEITERAASIEDTGRMRNGLLHHRALFEELLGERSDDTRRRAS